MAEFDPNIILRGQGVDVLGAMGQGNALAMQQNAMNQQNALSQLYQQQGPGMLAGDPNALNALARMDPAGALGLQQTQQQMRVSDEEMQMRRDKARADAATAAANLSAEQRAAASQKLTSILTGAGAFYKAGDQAGYQRFLQEQGVDPAQFPFADFQAHYAMGQGTLEGLQEFEAKTPEWRAATPEEAAANGAVAGQINVVTGKFDAQNPPSGMSITTGPNGTTIMQGPGVTAAKPLTEAEGKNSGFLIRMKDSGALLDQFETQGTDLAARMMALDPTGLTNYLQSSEYQQYDQAQRDFINAILRRESGAAIAPSEFENARQQYFPQPGDKPEVIAQKRQNRANAIAGVSVGAGSGNNSPLVTDGASGGVMPPTFAEKYQAAADANGVSIEALWEAWPNKEGFK